MKFVTISTSSAVHSRAIHMVIRCVQDVCSIPKYGKSQHILTCANLPNNISAPSQVGQVEGILGRLKQQHGRCLMGMICWD